LREEAERCLRLARSTTDQEAVAKLTALAAEYLDSPKPLSDWPLRSRRCQLVLSSNPRNNSNKSAAQEKRR
jgi:hypothetical protein